MGRIVTHRTSPHNVLEVWEDGHELREIVRKQKELATRKAALDKRKRLVGKAVRKAAALAKAAASGAMIPPPTPTPQAAGSAGVRDLTTLTGLDLIEADHQAGKERDQRGEAGKQSSLWAMPNLPQWYVNHPATS